MSPDILAIYRMYYRYVQEWNTSISYSSFKLLKLKMPNNQRIIRREFSEKKSGSVFFFFFTAKARKRVTSGDVRYLKGDLKVVKRPVLTGGPERGLIYSASPRGHRDSSLNAETRKRSASRSHGSAARRPFLRTEARNGKENMEMAVARQRA